jgi:hypothetical protein
MPIAATDHSFTTFVVYTPALVKAQLQLARVWSFTGITTSSVSLEPGWRGSLRFDTTQVIDQVMAPRVPATLNEWLVEPISRSTCISYLDMSQLAVTHCSLLPVALHQRISAPAKERRLKITSRLSRLEKARISNLNA